MNKNKVLTQNPRRKTRAQAIRSKCLDCCCNYAIEVKNCEIKNCPLWIYRMGYEVNFSNERIKLRVNSET